VLELNLHPAVSSCKSATGSLRSAPRSSVLCVDLYHSAPARQSQWHVFHVAEWDQPCRLRPSAIASNASRGMRIRFGPIMSSGFGITSDGAAGCNLQRQHVKRRLRYIALLAEAISQACRACLSTDPRMAGMKVGSSIFRVNAKSNILRRRTTSSYTPRSTIRLLING